MHKQYEELCALAATGQISGESMAVLDSHVKKCDDCRAFLQDVTPLKAQFAPVVAARHAQACVPPDGIRERFLQRAAEAGIRVSPNPVVLQQEENAIATESKDRQERRRWFVRWPQLSFNFAVPVAAALVCGLFGYWIAMHTITQSPSSGTTTHLAASQPPTTVSAIAPSVAQKEAAVSADRLNQLAAELAAAQRENRDLQQKLVIENQGVATLQQRDEQISALTQKLQASEAHANDLNAELVKARTDAAVQDAVLRAQQSATVEANAKSSSLQEETGRLRAELERVQALLPEKSHADELIAARNLHIVDVYDTESSGNRKRAFGRVFYVEGKALVFYAYDLPTKASGKRIEFKVWGEQAGAKTLSLSLGAMQSDSGGQSRWLLVCNDPKVLSKINAVYITQESAERHSSQPQAQKMMYAFLGTANHP